ncbi:MAG TPA: hypothetical protein VI588_02735 [Candidatus Gracilibacteria bacterium]|nr:hypothetical protein [Candidatus Gracilibacteria bacterium]
MTNSRDPEVLKIPAYQRKKSIISQAKQRLILTALDRKEARLGIHSKQATAPIGPRETLVPKARKRKIGTSPRLLKTSGLAAASQSALEPDIQSLPSKKIAAIGTVTHYLGKIDVAIIKLSAALGVGDTVIVEGENHLFFQQIEEIQIDRKPVKNAKKGAHIGVKTAYPAKVNGKLYSFARR